MSISTTPPKTPAIVIGQAVKKALGDFAGITRFGAALIPMDEALTRVAVDVANRPYLVWRVEIPKPKLGEMDTELFKEWFQAFAQNAGICLHIEKSVRPEQPPHRGDLLQGAGPGAAPGDRSRRTARRRSRLHQRRAGRRRPDSCDLL